MASDSTKSSTENYPTMKRDFSRVILTLNNVLVPEDKVKTTPSSIDGLDEETETDLRILGCELIQVSGILLKLPQVAMATGQVLFQRFYFSKSFVKHDMEVVAMACVNLASKIEENPRRIRDVINVFHHVKQVRAGKKISPLILDQKYINRKNQVIKAERRILKELGFCVHVKHPHKVIVMYLKVLECSNHTALVQRSWNYMNDSFRTDAFERFDPETIACACIYLAARELDVPLPEEPAWFACFHVSEEDIHDICKGILRLYRRKKPNQEQLEKVVEEAKERHIKAKLKAKIGIETSGIDTPSLQGSAANSPHPAVTAEKASPSVESKASPSVAETVKAPTKANSDRSQDSRNGLEMNNVSKKHRSYSRSRSRSDSSRSRSRDLSPGAKRYRGGTGNRAEKEISRIKDRADDYYYDSRSRYPSKHRGAARKRRRSDSYPRSRSPSTSPTHLKARRRTNKKHKERRRSPLYRSDKHRSRSRSRSRDVRKSKKHNGHRRSRTPERYRR